MPAPYTPAKAFSSWAGPRSPRTLFIGEAWGREESEVGKPFIGSSGKELFSMLGEANPSVDPDLHARVCSLHHFGNAWVKARESWYEAASVAFTNVLNFRPPDNKIEYLCHQKKDCPPGYSWPPISPAKYLDQKYEEEIARLWEEIESTNPNLIVLLGNTACWAVLGVTNISAIRGTITASRPDRPIQFKCLPTFHPANVLYNWSSRPIVVADLAKGGREAQVKEISRPARRVVIFPTLAECRAFRDRMVGSRPEYLAADVETAQGQVTTIGFSPSADTCFVIPLWDKKKPGWSYWTHEEEVEVLGIIESLLTCTRIIGQNWIYDMQYLLPMGIRLQGDEDTMLLHHSIFPEMQKGLGFLGSIYTSEPAWKLMRRRRVTEVVKADE